MSENCFFALDIGTRSIVGVVLQETPEGLEIIAAEHLEHRNRAMVDGQIHDIEQVADALKTVKGNLEAKIGRTLNHAAIAAAGRALKTERVRVMADLVDFKEIHRDDILRLELEAVQEAQNRLAEIPDNEAEDLTSYHCVGYSVVNYELDGHKIGSLYGQKGRNMGVDIIATFLPRVVVDSLFAALNLADLAMMSLTLEPIAASVVVVPPSMRQLNIALVDIGAGTSDIALTDDGSVVGYGMVPLAGDEVTEVISRHFLTDFNQAEVIKRSIHNSEEITTVDILGFENSVTKQEVLEVIADTVEAIAVKICDKILTLNGKSPQAVICIGGGSMTPLLKDMLADKLGLSRQRVAIRGREAIIGVSGGHELVGPEAVTPIGIAVSSYENKCLGFTGVTVNDRQVRLFEVSRGTVADALLAAGINVRKTRPRLGMALTVTVNGELKIIKGGRGTPAVIKLNGSDVTIDAPVKHNDVIEFTPAENGQDASGFVYDVVPQILPLHISINDEPLVISPVINMNNKLVTYNDELEDNARIIYHLPGTLAEILELAGHSQTGEEYHIYVNERLIDVMTEIRDGDEITLEAASFEAVSQETTLVYVNSQKIEIPRSKVILTDVLTRIDFPLTPPVSGNRLEMKVNDIPAEFTTPLKFGDNVTIEWK